VIGADQWRVADLRAGRLDRFSLETLIRYAARANCVVRVSLTPPSG
jgi:predicted XRE-type DNA-binding protein